MYIQNDNIFKPVKRSQVQASELRSAFGNADLIADLMMIKNGKKFADHLYGLVYNIYQVKKALKNLFSSF